MAEFQDIQQLVKLFNPPPEDDDSDNDYDTCEDIDRSQVRPNDPAKGTKVSPYTKTEPEKKEREEYNICNTENYSSDWKKTPKWDISYRQNVSASDVFLQMGAKTTATASCEDMIVAIELPGEHMQNIDIKVHPLKLEVCSPNFYLQIPLPQPVHPHKGDAKWDKDQEKLAVTLRMEREFDFINF